MADFQRYTVLGRVADGSTGTVWLARQPELNRFVAIKELAAAFRDDPAFVTSYRNEARTLASLEHPNVVRVFDYLEEPGRAWIVEEWVDGAALDEVIRAAGRFSPEQAVGVLKGALEGLAHAQQRGLVHGDFKPANILVDGDGRSKLVDFGLARPAGNDAHVGTPAYMSPEAIRGRALDARSDVYSAGAVLYELLAGHPPFVGTEPSVMAQHLSSPPPRIRGAGPLGDLVGRALEKAPEERPADAAGLLARLEEAAHRRFGSGWEARASTAALVLGMGAAGGSRASRAQQARRQAAGDEPAVQTAVSHGTTTSATRTLPPPAHDPPAVPGVRATTKVLGAIVAVTLIVGIVTAVRRPSGDEGPSSAALAAAADTSGSAQTTVGPLLTTTVPEPSGPRQGSTTLVAQARAAQVPVFDDPFAPQPKTTLDNPTDLGGVLVFLVKARGPAPGWLQVHLPIRPNGSLGWIREADVIIEMTPYYIRVRREAARLTVWNLNQIILDEPVALGRPGEPTPVGLFYLSHLMERSERAGPTNCFRDQTSAGRYMFFLSAFREFAIPATCSTPQVEMVGVGEPDRALLGAHTSHGAIRMSPEGVTMLANLLPLGTPVEIVP